MPLTLEVYGKNKLMARLANLQSKVLDKAAETSVRQVAVNIRDDAKRVCPVDTGSLRKSIRLQVQARPKKNVHKIGVSAGGYVTNPKSGEKVNYASHVEYGTSRQRPQPFLRPAIERHKKELLKIAGDEIKE